MAPVLTKSGVPSNRREKIPEGTLCVVCDDLASGIHYSVASCNGCKTFFRRALVNKQTFTCQFNGECLVGKNVRCVCRSCRLKKCFEQGMDKNAIQHDRDKIRYTKVLKREKEEAKARLEAERDKMMKVKEEIGSPGGIECCDVPSSSRSFGLDFEMMLPQETSIELDSTLKLLMRIEKKVVEVRNAYRFDDQISTIWNAYIGSNKLQASDSKEDEWLASVSRMKPMLFQLEDRNQHSHPSPYRCARVTPWSLREWFQRDLTLMMEWVKLLPGASQLITSDKVILLKDFALNYAVFQLTFYTRDTTVLGNPSGDILGDMVDPAEQKALEETLKSLKRRGEPLRTPPPPAPSVTTAIPVNLLDLANSLYKQPLPKRIKDEIFEDEPSASAYLRKLTEQAASFSADSSPSTSSFMKSSLESSFPSFLINNGLTGVTSFAEGLNQMASTIPSLPPTMSTGLPGALSNCLVSSLQALQATTPPSSMLPPYPNGFFSGLASSLANSPCGIAFPPSPHLTASPLVHSSPLMGMAASPLMVPSPLTVSQLIPNPPTFSLPPLPAFPSFLTPFPRAKTPEEILDVETVSMDGRSEGKGSHPVEPREEFIQPRSVSSQSISISRASSDLISNLNFMSMKSPDEPCSSRMREAMRSVSPDEIETISVSIANTPAQPSDQIKDEAVTPEEMETSVIKHTNIVDGEEETDLAKLEEFEERKRSEEDEETPCDPTPEAQIMNRINYPDGTFIERDKDSPSNDELYSLLIDGIWKVFRKLEIDQESFVLYKMMVFFNTELTHRGDCKLSKDGVDYVGQMREKMYIQLLLHLQRKRGKDGLKIFSNLLLLGPTISRARAALRNMFTIPSVFMPSDDLVDRLILRDIDERAPSPSAFRPYHHYY